MITWGRLTDLIKNTKGLTYESTLFFVFSQEHIQLFAIELNTGDPNLNDRGQLFLHGIDSKGVELSEIGGDYAPITEIFKRAEGLPFDRITLYQDGDFYRSWEFIQKADSFVLRANTIKKGEEGEVEDLQERWGSDIIGLTNESIQELANEVLPEVISYIRSTLLS